MDVVDKMRYVIWSPQGLMPTPAERLWIMVDKIVVIDNFVVTRIGFNHPALSHDWHSHFIRATIHL